MPFRLVYFIMGLIGGALTLASATLAQDTDDRDVTGPPRGITGGAPNASPQSPGSGISNRPGMRDGGIQVDRLSSITDANVGLLSETTGGFSRDMWAGSERKVLEALIPQLPVASSSQGLNDLTRRLLLTTATVPSGATSGESILSLRLQRLLDGGRFDDVVQLAAKIPSVNDSPQIAVIKAQAQLLTGQVTEACALAQSVKDASETAIWLKIRTYCFAAAGSNAAADLTAGLLREQGHQDEAFHALITRITTGATLDLPQDYQLTPIHLVMHAHLELAPADAVLATMVPGYFAAIAAEQRFDETLRLQSALRAESIGAISTETLAAVFDAVVFKDDVLAKPLSSADKMDALRAQALLYRAVKVSTIPSASAELMHKAFTLAQHQGTSGSIARLYWPVVRGLTASGAYTSVALDLARLALINGEQALAFTWFDLARQSGQVLAAELIDLRVLLAAAASSERLAWRSEEPYEWLGMGMADSATNRRIHEILILEGLGYPIARNTTLRMLNGATHRTASVASPVLTHRLKSALIGNRQGEALLLSLVILSDDPATLTSETLVDVFGALTQQDLQREGRQIVFDALLAGQVNAAHTAYLLREMGLGGE